MASCAVPAVGDGETPADADGLVAGLGLAVASGVGVGVGVVVPQAAVDSAIVSRRTDVRRIESIVGPSADSFVPGSGGRRSAGPFDARIVGAATTVSASRHRYPAISRR
jgi:hypothetical protein